MTPTEKLLLETAAGLGDATAANLTSIAAIHQLLGTSLPGLDDAQRKQLQDDAQRGLETARQLKENGKNLRSIVGRA